MEGSHWNGIFKVISGAADCQNTVNDACVCLILFAITSINKSSNVAVSKCIKKICTNILTYT